MKNSQPFNYAAFRYQVVKQIRAGNSDQVDLLGLLAPIISDILETALLPDSLPDIPIEILTTIVNNDDKSERKSSYENSGNPPRPNQHLRKQSPQPSIGEHSGNPSRPNIHLRPVVTEEMTKHAKQRIIELYREGSTYNTIEGMIYSPLRPNFNANFIKQTIGQLSVSTQTWQDRLLESVYICMWVIGSTRHVWQDDEISSVAVYSVVGINVDGRYEMLGHYTSQQAPNEFFHWLLDDMKSRGVKHIRIICSDSVFDIRTMSNDVFPYAHIHGIGMRILEICLKSLKGYDLTKVQSTLKRIYKAPTLAESEQLWQEVKTDLKDIYPSAITQWEERWPTLSGIFDYPDLIRRLIRDTKPVSLIQKLVDTSATVNGSDTTEDDLLQALRAQSMYMFSKDLKGRNNWGPTMGEVATVFSKPQKSN